ncbi:MAG: 50S ribosomal protein L7/L12 [Aggregatilineales bacterium]
MADLNNLVEQLGNLTVLEAVELKKILEEKWGVQASAGFAMPAGMAMPAAGGAAPAAAAPVEEQTEFTVVLKEVGPKKIDVIKVVRQLTNLGLKEAKDVVEGAPNTVLENVTKDAAADAKKKFEEVGAVAEVK